MLLPSLVLAALLIGILSLAVFANAWMGQPKRLVYPSLLNQQVSLWSLVLFLFFPGSNTHNNTSL